MEIVFDFDGTLVDSVQQIYVTTQRFFAEVTGEQVTLEEVVRREGGTFESTFANYGFHDAADVARMIPRWGELALEHEYQAYAGVADLLDQLEARGHRLHVWTARDPGSTRGILERTGLAGKFTGRIGGWNATAPKPDPRGLGQVVDGASAASVLMIGDGWNDLKGARGYGARSILALWGGHVDPKLREEPGLALALTPADCLALVGR